MFPSKDVLERIKLAFGILLGGLLVVVLAVMLIWPGRVAGGLTRYFAEAGIEVSEFALLGVKGKIIRQGELVQEAAAKARASLDEEKAKLTEMTHFVRCLSAGNCSAADQAKINVVRISGAEPSPALVAARADLDSAVQIVQQATATLVPAQPHQSSSERTWIAITGADRDFASANDEVRRLAAAGIPAAQTRVLLKDGWYRTIVYYPSRDAADAAAPAIANATGRQPYSRELNRWCPNAITSDIRYVRCGTAAR